MSMKSIWLIVWLNVSLASLELSYCPRRCSCSVRTDSNMFINCTYVGLETFPSVEDLLQLEISKLSQKEDSQHSVEIDLSRNEIIQAHFPSAWEIITKIDLSYNHMATLKNLTINEKGSVIELNLSHNHKLEKLTSDLRSDTLEKLMLNGCSINEVEDGFLEGVPCLKTLDISDNSLTELNGFASPTSRDASGSSENFTNTKRTHFQLSNLNVSHNKIHRIHGKELSATKLKVLDLSRNNVAHLKFTKYLPHLRELYMTDNHLRSFDGMALPSVLILDISKNKLRNVPIELSVKAPKLQKLNMSHNSIEKLSKITSSSITDLDFSYCRISSIESNTFASLERLQWLSLIGNELSALDPQLLVNHKYLQFLHLGQNPWKCDCESKAFKALYNFVIFDGSYSNGEDLHCEHDTALTWSDACKDFVKDNELASSKRGILYILVCAFLLLFIIMIILSCYKCIRQMRQSATISLDNADYVVSESDCDLVAAPNNDRAIAEESADASHRILNVRERRSTPPPNYETAIRLPQLTEEQRIMAISNLSLHNLP